MTSVLKETIKIGEGLDAANYPEVKAKIETILASGQVVEGRLAHWCESKGDCACMGCANRHMTWAEYECWRKYGPEFNKVSHPECEQENSRN